MHPDPTDGGSRTVDLTEPEATTLRKAINLRVSGDYEHLDADQLASWDNLERLHTLLLEANDGKVTPTGTLRDLVRWYWDQVSEGLASSVWTLKRLKEGDEDCCGVGHTMQETIVTYEELIEEETRGEYGTLYSLNWKLRAEFRGEA